MNLAFLPLTFQFLLFGSRGNGRPDTSWLGPFLEYDLMVMATGRGKRFWLLEDATEFVKQLLYYWM